MNKKSEFVDSLISQMTVREKIGQISMVITGMNIYDKNGNEFTFRSPFKQQVKDYGIGMMSTLLRADPWSKRTYGTGVELEEREEFVNKVQKYIIENSRLGIPALFDMEASHGVQALGSVMYPTNLGAACSFNPDLYEREISLIAKELKLSGIHIGFMTILDMCRDPRFGRSEESFGEDPLLASRLAASAVKGFKSQDVSICAKHFLAHGGAVGGHMCGDVSMGIREMRDIHLKSAKAAIDAGAEMLMAAYNSIDGIPCVIDERILKDLARDELGFDGIMQSDGAGVGVARGLVTDWAEHLAAAMSLNAGIDTSLGDDDGVFLHLEEALEQGIVSEERIDEAVRRVLMLKVKMGLFDEPYIKPGHVEMFVKSEECRQAAYDMAAASMVLLKNQDDILPLKSSQTIALIGPQAESVYHLLGDYTSPRKNGEVNTLREEMEKRFDKVTVAEGYKFNGGKSGFAEALDAARKSDVTILLMGGSSVRDFSTLYNNAGSVIGCGENFMDCGEGCDVPNIELPCSQVELLKELKALGKPVIAVLIQGRPYALTEVSEKADAILAAWYPGQMGAKAITDMLLGDIQPSGRLSVSIPRGTGYIPAAYNMYKTWKYITGLSNAIYPFGYGLSYMPKKYSNLCIDDNHNIEDIANGQCFTVSVDVENLGDKAINETVCLYISAEQQPVKRRAKELSDFKSVTLQPKQKKTVEFSLGKEALSYTDYNGKRVSGTGRFIISTGANPDEELQFELKLR